MPYHYYFFENLIIPVNLVNLQDSLRFPVLSKFLNSERTAFLLFSFILLMQTCNRFFIFKFVVLVVSSLLFYQPTFRPFLGS
jgi:hypothetical protein